MTGKGVQDQLENMQFAYSREKADKIVEEYETMTMTKFNKLYYHKYDTAKSKIRWDRREGIPYIILQSTTLECEQGKNRDIARNERKRKAEIRKRYNTVLQSKKKDCRATVKLVEVMVFPQYKVPNSDRRETVTASQRLREAFGSADGPVQEFRCYIKFPQQSEHSGHVVDEPVDYLSMSSHDVLPTIGGLVADGRLSIDVLKSALTNYMGEQPGSKAESEQKEIDLKVMEDVLSTSMLEAAQHYQYITMDENTYDMFDPQMGSFVKGHFGSDDSFPSCTCSYYKRSLVPCKHAMTIIRNSQNGLDIYPGWYLKLLQICAPKASESQRRETEACTVEANSYLNRFLQQVQDGRLTLEELKVLNIGFASIKEQLPDFTPDEGKFPRTSLQNAVSLKPRRAYITPPINNRSPRLCQDLITNGTHTLSLLKLKTLERELRGKEREKIKGFDKDFREGFLHEDIVNSYFFTLCQTDSRCVYVPTDVLFLLASGHQLNDREGFPTELDHKRFIFLPWMPGHTQPMVLLIVDMLTKQLVYLHPLREVDVEDETVTFANEFVQTKIRSRFNFEITEVVSVSRIYHEKHDLPAPVRNGQDAGFISVLICLYAKWYAEDPMNLNPVGNDMHVLREHIYDTIAGGCLEGNNGSRDHCRKCTSTEDQGQRIQCCRCNQSYHVACISADLGEVYPDVFVCPTSNPVDPPGITDWGDEVVQYITEGHTGDDLQHI